MITQAELDEIITDRRSRNPFHFEGQRDPTLTIDAIRGIEASHGIKFPEAYVHHISSHGAGDFAFGWIYSPDPTSGWSLWKDFDGYIPKLKDKVIPFSDNGCGDYYCFPITNVICEDRVLWADHESDYSLTDSDYSDFRDFILNGCLNSA